MVIWDLEQDLLTTRDPITIQRLITIQLLMSAPAMHAGIDTEDTEIDTATTMEDAVAMVTAISAIKAVDIAGITNG